MPSITVIIVTYDRLFLLEKAVNSLLPALANSSCRIDVKLVINGPDVQTKKAAEKWLFHIVELEARVSPAAARNVGLENVESSWVFFMDDDVTLPENYFKQFEILVAEHPDIDVWGGPNLTPPGKRVFDGGWYTENVLITGPIAYRYKMAGRRFSSGHQFNLMLCNLFMKAHCLKSRGFLSFFKTAEENELLYYITSQGWKMASSDSLFVWHERRSNPVHFLIQIFYYGYGRGQLLFHSSWKLQKIFILPPVLFATLIGLSMFYLKELGFVILLWLACLQAQFFVRYGKLSLLPVVLPLAIWTSYICGIFRGYSGVVKVPQKVEI